MSDAGHRSTLQRLLRVPGARGAGATLALLAWAAWAGAALGQQSGAPRPPQPPDPDPTPLIIYYGVAILLVGATMAAAVFPSKRGHHD